MRCSQMPEGVSSRSCGSQLPALFLWRVYEVFTDARGGSYDRMAVRCQLCIRLTGSIKRS